MAGEGREGKRSGRGCWVESRHHTEVTCDGGGTSVPAVRTVVGLGSWSVQGG